MSRRYELDKLRNILKDSRDEDLCLEDIIKALMEMSKDCATLEQVNDRAALKRTKSNIRKVRDMCQQFYVRMKVEVSPEVDSYYEQRKELNK